MKITLTETHYEPIGRRVLLARPHEDLNAMVNVGGVLVPGGENRRKNPIIPHRVLAAGPECKQVEEGDEVLANHLNAPGIDMGEEDHCWTEEQHIIAVIRKKEIEVSSSTSSEPSSAASEPAPPAPVD